ncbi:hypothetical protein FRB90_001209 [Tulasnella sp. 427]|nr:hypothetical protein FRB90_001209 [Tulasnella sp. 427]
MAFSKKSSHKQATSQLKAKPTTAKKLKTRNSGSDEEELLAKPTSHLISKKTSNSTASTRTEDPVSGFRQYLGSSAEELLRAASAEINAGYRPDRGTQQPSKQKVSKKEELDVAADSTKGQPGRKKKTHFSVRAVAWIASGVDDCGGEKAPDYGACCRLAMQGLAVVAKNDCDLQFPRECTEDEMYEWLARDDMFRHIFSYYDQQLNPPSRSGKGKGKAVQRRKKPVVVQVKSSGQSRRLEPAREEPICGAAVESRFPFGKSWDKRILYLTGPLPIPEDVIATWSMSDNKTEGDDEEDEADENENDENDENDENSSNDEMGSGYEDNGYTGDDVKMEVDESDNEGGDANDEPLRVQKDSNSNVLPKHTSRVSSANPQKRNVTSARPRSRQSLRTVSGASTSTSRSQATSTGTKRARSTTSDDDDTSAPPLAKQRKRSKGNGASPIIISDDDSDLAGPSRPPSRPRPRTRSATIKASKSSSANEVMESTVKQLDRQISELLIGTYIDSATVKRLAGSDSDD